MHISISSVVVAGLLCSAASAQTYNAAAEFSPTANPTGVWSYGLRPGQGGTFFPFSHTTMVDNIDFWDRDLPFPDAYPKVGHNGTSQTQFWGGPEAPLGAGELVMHPGPVPAVLRFTAPTAGRYAVIVHLRASATCFTGTGTSVWHGAAQLDGGGVGGAGGTWSSSRETDCLAGDTIDLVIDDGGNGINCDHVATSLIISRLGCGPADVGSAGGAPGPDNALNNNDFIAFINFFFAGDARADFGRAGGQPGADGAYDNNDFIAFINAFFAGC
ncbi:MAG: GC-type dockerin domain-anchored protein [Phycisphaerales bacterium]